MAQEAHDVRPFVSVGLRRREQAASGGDRADDREVVVGERDAQQRRVPLRGVRPHHAGPQVETGFVHPDDGSLLLSRLLF